MTAVDVTARSRRRCCPASPVNSRSKFSASPSAVTCRRLTTSAASSVAVSLYALRILRHHGLNDVGLQTVFRAVVVSRLTYASPAWRGFITATDLKRVDAFLRRCKRCGYCSSDLPAFEELLDKSDRPTTLFSKTLNNSTHTLHTLLPPLSAASQYYHLRRRTDDRQLPTLISDLCIKNLITRALYKDCYWIFTPTHRLIS